MRRITLIAAACCLSLAAPTPASAKRVAFVVGIDAYDNLPAQEQLQKAVNDSRAIGTALAGLGYQLVSADNADRRGFNESWQKFLSAVEPGDETAFFFAGHGVEIGGLNYLLPRDVPAPQSGQSSLIKNESLSVTDLLADLADKSPRVSLIILDACRDNPFAAEGTRSVGGTRGLARVDPPEGTFVLYSAGAGQTALDRLSNTDADPDSVFTRSLVPLLKTKGLALQDVALRVREDVAALAGSVGFKQTPAYYDQLIGRVCLAGCEADVAKAKPPEAAAPSPSGITATPAPTTPPSGSSSSLAGFVETALGHLLGSSPTEPGGASISSSSQPSAANSGSAVGAGQGGGTSLPATSGGSGAEPQDPNKVAALTPSAPGGAAEQPQPPRPSPELIPGNGGLVRTIPVGTDYCAASGVICQLDAVAFSPDGERLATGDDGKTAIWNVRSGELLLSLAGEVEALAFSPRDANLAVAARDSIKIYDLAARKAVRSFEAPGSVASTAFSRDGRLLALSTTDGAVSLLDAATGEALWTARSDAEGEAFAVAISADGTLVATANEHETVKLWDAKTGAELRIFSAAGQMRGVAFSASSHELVAAGIGTPSTLWDIRSGKELRRFGSDALALAVSPDGTLLATADLPDNVSIWELATGRLIETFSGHSGDDSQILSVAFSPDGRLLASASTDGTAKLWSINGSAGAASESSGAPTPAANAD